MDRFRGHSSFSFHTGIKKRRFEILRGVEETLITLSEIG